MSFHVVQCGLIVTEIGSKLVANTRRFSSKGKGIIRAFVASSAHSLLGQKVSSRVVPYWGKAVSNAGPPTELFSNTITREKNGASESEPRYCSSGWPAGNKNGLLLVCIVPDNCSLLVPEKPYAWLDAPTIRSESSPKTPSYPS